MDANLQENWGKVLQLVSKRFGPEVDMQAILFLIGIQELGKGHVKLNKSQKVEVMHIAICSLLSRYGYYELKGYDEEGWPHWELNDQLPHLHPSEQETLMKQAIVEYFEIQ
jgi:hypothetical protein